MSSLSQRLQKLQVKVAEPLPDVSRYSMQELDQMKIEFGTKHLGHSFQEVWNDDQQWISWFVKHYQNSTKGVHRLMIQYIELKVERAELEGEEITVQESAPQLHRKMPIEESGKLSQKLMAKAKARPEMPMASESLTDWDIDFTTQELIEAQPDFHHLEGRMLQLETAVQNILGHLEQMAIHQGHVRAATPVEQ